MFDQKFENSIEEKIEILFSNSVFDNFSPLEDQIQELKFLFRCSEFSIRVCLKYPHTIKRFFEKSWQHEEMTRETYLRVLQDRVACVENFEELSQTMRDYRYEQTIRIVWRDLVMHVSVEQILKELSWLADACIVMSVNKLSTWMIRDHGQPLTLDNKPMHLVVLAMGKLGADELNFSSDIDLIFCYQDDGNVSNEQGKSITHSQYYIRLCQQLVKLLSDLTAWGFVYRVDTRLRPFGESSQLALSFSAMETYYERHGREWERYAMVKARPICEDERAGNKIIDLLHPFVYRRYLDFGAFASLREMKGMIDTELIRKGEERNVKLGQGGIREIEFIGQAFQLIRGGRTPRLQQRGILSVLATLFQLRLIPEFVFIGLRDAYLFLRKTENVIQAYAEQQTHVLPSDSLMQHRLVYALGFESWSSFQEKLDSHMTTVHEHFEQMFSAPQLDGIQKSELDGALYEDIWQGVIITPDAEAVLHELGYDDANRALRRLGELRESSKYRTMGPGGKQRFDKLMPLLIQMVAKISNPDICLLRIIRLLEAVAKRTAYIALLAEYPLALSQLVKLFDKSPWIADLVISYPILLDELIDPRRLYEPLIKIDLENELNYVLDNRIEDLERQISRLIDFKQSNFLRVAASELMNTMPVEKVSDHLTYIAETVMGAILKMARDDLVKIHGWPTYIDGEIKNDNKNTLANAAGFCIIAYGKLGGMELGFGSDLDLVFLHDSQGEQQITDGEKKIDNAVFYARLGQRIIRFLNTPTQSGRLYEVDVRLRPSGGSGVLVSNVKSFFEYQKTKAWTWEHQALVRARFLDGSSHLKQEFEEIRRHILCLKRDKDSLRRDVCEMRTRMRQESIKAKDNKFDIKQGVGGIIDIEFIIQYLVLYWANEYPDIVTHTDNARILDALVKNTLIQEDNAKILRGAYLMYRHVVHENILRGKNTTSVNKAVFRTERKKVEKIWDELMACP